MWEVRVGREGKSNGGIMGTTVIEQKFKKMKKRLYKKKKQEKSIRMVLRFAYYC